MSAVAITACEVQVSIGCWFSDRSNCSHWSLTLTFTLTSENLSLYTTLLLLLVLIQLCSPRCWHIDSNSTNDCARKRPLAEGWSLGPARWEPRLKRHSIDFRNAIKSIIFHTVVQGIDNHSWGLYCRRCYCIRICWERSSRIFHFSRWLGQLSSPN